MVTYGGLFGKDKTDFSKYHKIATESVEKATKALEFQGRFVLQRKGVRDTLEAKDLVHDLEVAQKEVKAALDAAKKMKTLLT